MLKTENPSSITFIERERYPLNLVWPKILPFTNVTYLQLETLLHSQNLIIYALKIVLFLGAISSVLVDPATFGSPGPGKLTFTRKRIQFIRTSTSVPVHLRAQEPLDS